MPAPDYSTEIAALEAGLASGEARVESDGDMIIYRSTDQIRAALSYFRQQQALVGNGAAMGRPATTVAVFDPR